MSFFQSNSARLAWQVLALAGALAAAVVEARGDEGVVLGAEPHPYAGDRGTEPELQSVFSLSHRAGNGSSWQLAWHWEAETFGRRDSTLDLDRAWYRVTDGAQGAFTLGRIHPWDLSRQPDAERPWGYLAQTQSLNRGVLLGIHGWGADPAQAFPQPVMLGWLGAHYFSDTEDRAGFAWGFSATPIFVPSLGSEVSLEEDRDVTSSRFGRRPPGRVEVNGRELPLRYRIDRSRLFQDIILQPQLMAQARVRADLGGGAAYRLWLSATRAPAPDPLPDAQGYLSVTPTQVNAVADVVPRFPERWLLTAHQLLTTPALPFSIFAAGAAAASSEARRYGAEIGISHSRFAASVLHEELFEDNPPSFQSEGRDAEEYSSWLAQVEGRLPLGARTELHGGVKEHLRVPGTWLRSGARFRLRPGISATQSLDVDLGFELFGGGDESYFGEWRTNDRVYLSLLWRFG